MDSEIIHHRLKRRRSLNGDVDCNLTDDLLIEILSRLSSGVVTRFKLVCKHWYSLISSHYFVTVFNRRRNEEASSPAEYSLMLQFQRRRRRSGARECNDYYSPVFHCGSSGVVQRVHKLDLSFIPNSSYNRITIKASCGDLILCSHYDELKPRIEQFYICNPRNKQWITLPALSLPTDCRLANCNLGLLYLPSHHGGSVRDKYVVVLSRIIPSFQSTSLIEVFLFSSEEGQWRERLISSPEKLEVKHNRVINLVPYKGKLHWVNYPYVLVYDPYNDPGKISRVIRMQMQRENDEVFVRSAGVLQDRIRVAFTKFERPKFHCVLELEDYGMGKWRMVKKVMETDLNDMLGYALHDGNALCWKRNCYCLWLRNLEQSIGVAVDEDHKCEFAHLPHNSSLLYVGIVNQVDFSNVQL